MGKNKSVSQLKIQKCKEKVPSSGQTKKLNILGAHINSCSSVVFGALIGIQINLKVLKK